MVIRGRRARIGGLKATLDMLAPAFRKAIHNQVKVYDRLGAKYAVIGGLAVGAYSEPRGTKDIDFLVDDAVFDRSQSTVVDCFKQGLPLAYDGISVDSVVGSTRYTKLYIEALKCAVPSDEDDIPIVTPEFLAIMKLDANRPQDRLDLVVLITAGAIDMDKLADLVDDHEELSKRLDRTLDDMEEE